MDSFRRDFLKLAGSSVAGAAVTAVGGAGAYAQTAPIPGIGVGGVFNIRMYGAKGDGAVIDTPAINKAIEAAAASGGGTVFIPAGNYLSYSIRLQSGVSLFLDQGAVIVAADPLPEGQTGGYDEPGPAQPLEQYQDFGHNHWRNSLIWGEGLHDISIVGPGRIWGRGLSRDNGPQADSTGAKRTQGIGNKSIGLKNCHNVLLRDFQILQGGWFGILATGVDNLTIDNLKIDTNRDGMDIDCCRNVRVSNCSVNSPWDDGICPKSSFALGYARATENLTITNCYVTGAYELGTMLDGTWKRWPADSNVDRNGRIKCGTESNGGFKNITISNCVFDGCGGFALESVDGALLEDLTITGITMRDCINTPIFLRLGSRMRGPAGTPVGKMKRILINNLVSYNSVSRFGGAGLISGIPGHPIEDIAIHNVYMEYRGGGRKETAALQPPEDEGAYPEPTMFGEIPASGFFVRNVKNIEFANVEIAVRQPDARPVFWLGNVDGVELFRVKTPKLQSAPIFALKDVENFSVMASRNVKDMLLDKVDRKEI